MHITQAKNKLATYIHDHVEKLLGVKDDIRTHDIIEFLEVIAGIYVESCFLFEKPDIAMSEGFEKLSASLGVAPTDAVIPYQSISHPQKLDARTEQGRALARSVLEEFGECEFSFCEFILWMVSNYLVDWEGNNIPRSDGFRLFMDAATRCMAFEISAQELCDIVIEKRIGTSDWSLAERSCWAGNQSHKLPHRCWPSGRPLVVPSVRPQIAVAKKMESGNPSVNGKRRPNPSGVMAVSPLAKRDRS